MMGNRLESLFTAACSEDLKAMCRQTALQGAQNLNFVVDNQNTGSTFAHLSIPSAFPTGNVKRKILPPPGRSSTQICPPCASTNPLLTAKPSPEPGTDTALR